MIPPASANPSPRQGTAETMTVWTTHGDGIEMITPHRLPIPSPGPGEVSVKVAALSLNYRDLLVINGRKGWKPDQPVVPVSDAVGTVVATGEGAARFAASDRVSAMFLPKWQSGPLTSGTYVNPTGGPVNRGMLAEYVVINEDEAANAPRTTHPR